MSYLNLIHRLFHANLFSATKLGLQNVLKLQKLLHYPDRQFQSIHVAGTNGKGSVTTKIATAFEKGGYRVGLFNSPHISSFRERIRINGKMISEAAVASLLSFLFATIDEENIPATFFEITTLLAFLYFAQEKVDIAVIETGLGGRLDATNIVLPCLSIITSISLDHTDILGETHEKIAKEKGGIIKENIPIVIGPHVPKSMIQSMALEKNSPCIMVNQTSPLFEEENRYIAQTALNYLAPSFNLSEHDITKGLDGKQPCRFEIIRSDPYIILDVAHNPDGFLHLFRSIQHHFPNQPLRIVFGISKNKDLTSCLKIISLNGKHFHLVEAANGRGFSVEELRSKLLGYSIEPSQISAHESIAEGILQAQQEARKQQQIVVICGSFFIMGQARQTLGFKEPYDAIDLNERLLAEK